MFGQRRTTASSTFLEPAFTELVASARDSVAASQEQLTERWGIGTADRWDADLAAGTITFAFPDRTLVGPVEVIGRYTAEDGSWLWAWADHDMPDLVTNAAEGLRRFGKAGHISALTTRELRLPDPAVADDLAAIAVEVAGLAGFYRAATSSGAIYLGLIEFAADRAARPDPGAPTF